MARSSNSMAQLGNLPPAEPTRLALLLREIRWFCLVLLGLFLLLCLLTYNKADPAWSVASANQVVTNKAGRLGAWVADVLFYLFGVSAYWWVVLCLRRVWSMLGRLLDPLRLAAASTRPWWMGAIGFVVLLGASCALEALRLHTLKVALPGAPGGVLGAVLSDSMAKGLGFTGGTLSLIVLLMIGASLYFGFSWLSFAERVGRWIEQGISWLRASYETRQDVRAGQVAAQVREEVVEKKHEELFETHEPVRIEPQIVKVPEAPRVIQEKQQTLFREMQNSTLPPLSLLDAASNTVEAIAPETLEFTSRLIEKKLADHGVVVKVVTAQPGPVITRYEIEPASGVKGSQVVGLAKDLARALSLVSIRVVETIPGKNLMGLELPNPRRQPVRLSEILGSTTYNQNASPLTLALGKDISGGAVVADLAKMPHLLVAGTTGSGKSVGINAMILSLLYKADASQVRMILIDPKMLEMSVYEGIPHLLAPVVTDMRHAANALNWTVAEMERRYKLMSKLGVRNLAGYNSKIQDAEKREEKIPNPFSLTPESPEPLQKLPAIVVVIDELADLMMVVGKKIEELIARIAQKARAAGIHLVLATQRPSVDVITGLIKANIPTRIAFQVSSKIDSRTILDQMGAEALLGQGDMLYMASGTGVPVRVHGAFVSDDEVHRVVSELKQHGEPDYIEGLLEPPVGEDGDGANSVTGIAGDAEADPMYDQAVKIVLENKKASISLVQRHLRIGYNRAARLLEAMEKAGLIGSLQPNGQRDILVGRGNSE